MYVIVWEFLCPRRRHLELPHDHVHPVLTATACRASAETRSPRGCGGCRRSTPPCAPRQGRTPRARDRKSTRLNSSHVSISYAVFCLKKKKKNITPLINTKHLKTSQKNILKISITT